MKYLKLFDTENSLQTYMNNNWNSPHIYYAQNNRTTDYEEKYIELEYISSTQTGGQYIDLGCHLMENTDDIKIDIKFNFKGRGMYVNGDDPYLSTLVSSQSESSPWPGFVLRILSQNSNKIHLQAKWQFTNSVKRNTENKYDSKYLTY